MAEEKDYADLTDEEQVALIQSSPNHGNTDNSPGFPSTRGKFQAFRQEPIEQPPQHPDWQPDPDQMGEWL